MCDTKSVIRDASQSTEIVRVFWFSLLFALVIGVRNGEANQAFYLLYGLRLADPTFLVGDWYTWQVHHNHTVFSGIVAALDRGGILEAGLAAGALLQSVGLALAVYVGVRCAYDRPLPAWAAAVVLLAAVRVPGLEGWGLIYPQFDAFALSGMLTAVGLALLLTERTVLAGTAFGLAGLVHAHYAVLLMPVLFGPVVAERRGRHLGTAIRLWGPILLIASPTLYRTVSFALVPGAEGWHEVYVARFPFHVYPRSWPSFRWGLFLGSLSLGAAGLLIRRPRVNRRFTGAAGMVLLLVVGSLLLGFSAELSLVTKLWPWRLAPFVIVLSLVTFGAALWEPVGSWKVLPKLLAAVGTVTLATAVMIGPLYYAPYYGLRALVALLAVGLAPSFVRSLRRQTDWKEPSLALATLVFLSVGLVPSIVEYGARRSHVEIRPQHRSTIGVYEWVKSNTPTGTLFVVPPTWLEDFRLITRRPIIVDLESMVGHPDDAAEWYRRLQDVTGLEGPASASSGGEPDVGYAKMDCARAAMLRAKYGAEYVVFRDGQPPLAACAPTAFRDRRYTIVDIRAVNPRAVEDEEDQAPRTLGSAAPVKPGG